MQIYNPPHPGETLLELYIKPLSLTITETADALGVTRRTLSELVNGHRSVSTEMAERLAIAFGGGAITWLNQQVLYDLWIQKKKRKKLGVQQLYKKAS
jgi:addiction module HigA family antidote